MEYDNIKDTEFLDAGFASKFLSHTKKLNINSDIASRFYRYICLGDNKVGHNLKSVAISVDDKWVYTIENCLFYVENIIRNPKKFIKEEEYLVNVERARRAGAKAVRYLSSHTSDISNVKDGRIIPKRVLSTALEEDLGIYENRFVCALVNRLILFVEERNNEINGRLQAFDRTFVTMDSSFRCGQTDFHCKIEMTAEEPPLQKVTLEKNEALTKKLNEIRKRLQIIKGTEVMKYLDSLKPVYPPIAKTNILRMNVDYRNCYELWLYISAYRFTGLNSEISEKDLPVSDDYFDDLAYLAAINLKSLVDTELIQKDEYKDIPFSATKKKKYKVIRNISYTPNFLGGSKKEDDPKLVNEYFYNKMLAEFKKAVGVSNLCDLTDDREVRLAFARFFNSINRISNGMYDEVISTQKKKSNLKKKPAEKKREEITNAKNKYRRLLQLAKLKEADLSKLLKQIAKENTKVNSLINELNTMEAADAASGLTQSIGKIKEFDVAEREAKLRELEDEYAIANTPIEEVSQKKREKATRKLEEDLRRGYALLKRIGGDVDFVEKKNQPRGESVLDEVGVQSDIDTDIIETDNNEEEKETAKSYNKSFSAKYIQSSPELQFSYSELKNYFARYAGLRNRISWGHECFFIGRKKMALITLRGKSIYLYLNLVPEEAFLKVKNVSSVKKYEEVPSLIKIRTARSLLNAKALIEQTFAGVTFQVSEMVDYSLPYQTDEELLAKHLIKPAKRKSFYIKKVKKDE